MTFGFWAAVTSTPVTVNIYSRQYYGSGTGATPESSSTRVLIGSAVLSSTWTWFPINFTVPSVAGGSLGTPGMQTDDDALYIQIDMPLGAPCDILFTKPALFLGSVDPDTEFDSYDMIDSIDQTPRCGDVKATYWSSAPLGWVPMNDGTIGNVGSGATLAAGQYTFQLYKTLWDAVSNTYAPVTGGRGATAQADFIANKALMLPLSLGRSLAGAGSGSGLTTRVLGQNIGTENNTLTVGNLPSPLISTVGTANVSLGAGATALINNTSGLGIILNSGGGNPTNNMQPTSFMNIYIKL
jgi:microcystin-dependent protein